ncbi:MAG TPA: site-2 protease family protein [Vicinamibacterales bacterium]|nr:site-2 protease family protein [Vicinamibacterales bacterium]
MRWSVKVGQLAGTVVYVHVTFFVLLAWIGVIDGLEKGSLAAAVEAVGFTTTLFACVVLHEFGHAFMARRFGIRTRDILLFPFGGVGRLERIPDVPSQELLIALAGPAVSVGIATALFAVLWLQGIAPRLEEFAMGEVPFTERLMFINAGLAAFNLLPAFPMDGGRVLRALLAMRIDYMRATELAARIGQGLAVLFAIVGAMTNPLLVIIALFVWMGAAGEAGLAQIKRALRGATVDSAMRTEFGALAPGDAIGRAAEMAIRHAQSDFPVLLDGHVVGLLTRHDLTRWLSVDGADRTAGEVMHRTFETIRRSEPLDAVFGRLSQEPGKALLVMDHGRLVGLVGLDEITNLLRVRRAVARRQPTVMGEEVSMHRRAGTR